MCRAALSPPGKAAQPREAFQAGYCIGAADAAFDALVIEGTVGRSGPLLCPKSDSGDKLELVRVVVRHLQDHREDHGNPAGVAIRKALRAAYPCP